MNIYTVIAKLIGFYSTLIWIRIILTWLPSQRTAYGEDGPVISILKSICDPFLKIFKGSKTTAGNIDFSPLLALMSLNILQSVFNILSQNGVITIPLVLVLIIGGLWNYFFSFILMLLCIALAVRYICGRKISNPRNAAFLAIIDPIIRKPVNFVASIFYPKKAVSDQQYVLTALIFYVVIYFAVKKGLVYLIAWLSSVRV